MTATFSGVGGRVKREAGGCRVDVGSGVSRAEREGKERVREKGQAGAGKAHNDKSGTR
jgi:hypothetical protein